MSTITDDSLIQKIISISSAFRQDVHLAYEKQSVYQNTLKQTNSPKDSPSNRSTNVNTELSAAHRATMIQIMQNNAPFYILLKAEKAKKGNKFMLLFSPAYSLLINIVSKEIEVLPEDAQYFIDKKSFIIIVNGQERKFSHKEKYELLELIIDRQFQTTLEPFFLSYLSNGVFPPSTNLISSYLYKIVFNESFLVAYQYIPSEFVDDQIIRCWYSASIQSFDNVFTSIVSFFLRDQKFNQIEVNEDSFIMKLLKLIVKTDEKFGEFIKTIGTTFDDPQTKLLPFLAKMRYKSLLHMAMFIIYIETSKKFNVQSGYLAVAKLLFYAAILPSLKEYNCQKQTIFTAIMTFSPSFDNSMHSELREVLQRFTLSPQKFKKPLPIYDSYLAYRHLLDNISKNEIDFLSIIRRMEKDIAL